jgi:hypothetical protein
MSAEFVKQAVLYLLFLIMLSIPFVVSKYDQMANSVSTEDREEIIDRYGFFLQDVTQEANVDFKHRRPVVDEELHHILPQISSIGASVAVSDYDNDGLPDFYLTNSEFGTQNALYRNEGDGTFSNQAEAVGLAEMNGEDVGASMGSIWGDFDNDGFEDLFIYRWGKPELFKNENGTSFRNVTDQAGLPDHLNANTALWIDYNRDGLLDLFVGGYYHEDVDLFDLEDTKMMPDSYEYATNGGLNYLFENQGNGQFRDVSEEMGLQETRRWTLASSSTDLDNNGYPDIVLANDYGVDEIFLNQGGSGFINAGESSGVGFTPKSGMSVSFGDILNQGEYSIYITNISEAGVLMQGNNLWVPRSRGDEEVPEFRNLASNLGVEVGDWAYSGQFLDFNNDGNQDLYIANGYVSAEPNTDYWYDYTKVVGGNRAIIIDAKNWPAMNNRTFSGYQANKLWLNDGAGRFQEVAHNVGAALRMDSRSVAYADFFGNGTLDLIVANQHQEVKLYRNIVDTKNNWIEFKLEGRESNRSAIGATLFLYWDGKVTRKSIQSGEAFSSQSQRPVHFGLGEAQRIDRVEIHWPSGRVQSIESPEINKQHEIIEPTEEL